MPNSRLRAIDLVFESPGIVEPGGDDDTVDGAASDIVALDPPPQLPHRRLAQGVEASGPVLAEVSGEIETAAREARRDHAAVPAGCSIADRARFEQHGLGTALGEREGGRETGEATAYDADTGRGRSLERRCRGRRLERARMVEGLRNG